MITKLMFAEKDQGIKRIPMNKDFDQMERNPINQAFLEWKEAADEWVSLYRELEHKERPLTLDEKKRLRYLEQRLNKAAERYELALDRSN